MRCKVQIFALLVCALTTTFSFTLRKCCPHEYSINNSMTGCTRKSTNTNSSEWIVEPGLLAELPPKFLLSVANGSEKTAFHIPCEKTRTLMWSDDDESDFHVDHVTGVLRLAMNEMQGKPSEYSEHEYCLDELNGIMIAIACLCTRGTCVNVCCEKGMLLDTSSPLRAECVQAGPLYENWTLINEITKTDEEPHFFVSYGSVPECSTGAEMLNKNSSEPHQSFHVLPNGSLLINSNKPYLVEPASYCVGVISYNNSTSVNVIQCSPVVYNDLLHGKIYSVLFLIGALFLLATLVVHALISEMRRSVHGLSLMAHCACMFIAHIALTIVQLKGSTIADVPCHFIAYIIQYSLLAGFFWMNVMCNDIALTFRSLQSMANSGSTEYRKFMWYTLYAMGVPFLIFLVTLWADASSIIPAALKPNIGIKFCWFDKSSHAILIFFYGPIGLLLIYNLILFVFTSLRILQYSRASAAITNQTNSRRHDRGNADHKKFMLFLKLFGLMGIPWITEIISWAVGGADYYWYLTDAINLLRSVFIFIMFCCKHKVWFMLTRRYPKISARISQRLSRGDGSNQNGDDISVQTRRSSLDLPNVTCNTHIDDKPSSIADDHTF